MNGPETIGGADQVQPGSEKRSLFRRWTQIGLTGRMFLLVVIAVLPALAIQGVNEYTLRASREDDIRERVIQITKQFGEEMKEAIVDYKRYWKIRDDLIEFPKPDVIAREGLHVLDVRKT